MNRIINWIFGSFFRTLGRILVYILIGYLLFNLINLDNIKLPLFNLDRLFFMNVNADVIKIPSADEEGYVYIDNNLFSEYYDLSPITANSDTNFRISLTTLNSVANDYPFLFVDICSTAEIYAYRTSSLGQSCTNSCFSNQVSVIKTNYNCTANSYQGNIYRLKVPITKWGDGVDTDTKNINDRLSIGANINYNAANTIYGIYLSNDINEVLENIDYTSTINNVNNNISSSSNDIINNQNSNSQAQINNANANTDKTIDSQKVCNYIDKNICKYDNKVINNSGEVVSTGGTTECATDYINVEKSTLELLTNTSSYTGNTCFYTVNKTVISCIYNTSLTIGKITIPANASYIRTSISKRENKPTFNICKNGNQAIGDSLNDMNSSINNSDSSQATNDASNFFSNFTTNTHGLTGIITAPLNAINSLTSSQCSPLVLPLPFINEDLTLPCMRTIYDQYFGNFMTLYDVITLGIVSYWVMVRIFGLVKDFKNPEHDEIEVVDL